MYQISLIYIVCVAFSYHRLQSVSNQKLKPKTWYNAKLFLYHSWHTTDQMFALSIPCESGLSDWQKNDANILSLICRMWQNNTIDLDVVFVSVIINNSLFLSATEWKWSSSRVLGLFNAIIDHCFPNAENCLCRENKQIWVVQHWFISGNWFMRHLA